MSFTTAEHHEGALQYRDTPAHLRDKVFAQTGVRYAKCIRLSYFDSVLMGVLDLMHNILLDRFFLGLSHFLFVVLTHFSLLLMPNAQASAELSG